MPDKDSPPAPSLRQAMAAALARHRAGHLAEAEAAYREILAVAPNHVDSLQLLGALAAATGRHDMAIELIGQALVLSPGNAVAHSNLGYALRRRGRVAEAMRHFEQAVTLKPDYAEAHFNLGAMHADQGRLEEAAAEFQKAIAFRSSYVRAFIGLGETRLKQRRRDEAIAAAESAAALVSTPAAASCSLGALFAQCGLTEKAVRHLESYLEYDPADREGAGVILADLGVGASHRASDAQIAKLYSARADRWDESPYYGHKLVAGALERLAATAMGLDIVDAGCGTGLVGQLVAPFARRLDGVDISPEMLAKAEQKKIYTTLHLADFVGHLAKHPQSYDVVTCAATLIHFGDLRPAFLAAATALRNGGLFIFTAFPNDEGDDGSNVATTLARNGCFTHSRVYIIGLAAKTGFDVELVDTETHEYSDGAPLLGLVVALRRQAREN